MGERAEIDASGLSHRELNDLLARIGPVEKVVIRNVFGHRYVGTRLGCGKAMHIEIFGTPGNNLGAFMNGHRITVFGNAQDGVGNTMSDGEIVIHGSVGDVLGMSMRGGAIYVRGDAGYRAGVHMKEFGEKRPKIVIGGTVRDFLGEYMAGGIIVVLNLSRKPDMKFIGSGMHGGAIYIRGEIDKRQLSKYTMPLEVDEDDLRVLGALIDEFSREFHISRSEIMGDKFVKLVPRGRRPYGSLYALRRL